MSGYKNDKTVFSSSIEDVNCVQTASDVSMGINEYLRAASVAHPSIQAIVTNCRLIIAKPLTAGASVKSRYTR